MEQRLRAPADTRLSGPTPESGFSLLELLVAIAVVLTLTGIAIGVTPAIVRMARGESGAQELDGFLKRHREMAIARRRDIQIEFFPPNQVRSTQRAVPPSDPDDEPFEEDTVLETLTFEGNIEYWKVDDAPDTPSLFTNEQVIDLGGAAPVMFSSEGAFIDAAGDPVNATISLGVEGDPLTATAVTILGTTAMIQRYRWNGASWAR